MNWGRVPSSHLSAACHPGTDGNVTVVGSQTDRNPRRVRRGVSGGPKVRRRASRWLAQLEYAAKPKNRHKNSEE
jgi:hypothetical protein